MGADAVACTGLTDGATEDRTPSPHPIVEEADMPKTFMQMAKEAMAQAPGTLFGAVSLDACLGRRLAWSFCSRSHASRRPESIRTTPRGASIQRSPTRTLMVPSIT